MCTSRIQAFVEALGILLLATDGTVPRRGLILMYDDWFLAVVIGANHPDGRSKEFTGERVSEVAGELSDAITKKRSHGGKKRITVLGCVYKSVWRCS